MAFDTVNDFRTLRNLIETKEALERWLLATGYPKSCGVNDKDPDDAKASREERIEAVNEKLAMLDEEIWNLIKKVK